MNSEQSACEATTTFTKLNNQRLKERKRPYTQPEEEILWSKTEHFHKVENKAVKRKKVKIAPCTWSTKLLNAVLLILYWMTVAFAQEYEILQPNSGFYVENLGRTHIKRGNLRLQITLTTEEIYEDQAMIKTTWSQIRDICAKTKALTEFTHCDKLFRHLTTRQQNLLMATEEIVQQFQSNPTTRRRRGILGNILTTIFGVNDQVYTEIEHIGKAHENLVQATNQQALFLNSKINQSTFEVEGKLRQFDARLKQVIDSVNEMSSWYTKADHNRIGIEVITAYLGAEDFYNELEQKYKRWLNAIHEHGHILDFINTYDIKRVIENTTSKLATNLLILKTPQPHVDVKVLNSTLSLYGYLNIIERNNYELLHVTPLPRMIQNSSFIIADIKFTTLAVNFDLQTYFTLEEEELRTCTTYEPHIFLCSPRVIHNIDENPCCVIDQIYERHSHLKCDMQRVELSGTMWKALMMKNAWLYITTKPRVVSVICKGIRKELLLNNTGIIHLRNDCVLKTKETMLKTTVDEEINVISSHVREISPEMTKIEFEKPPVLMQSGLLIPPQEHILSQKTLSPISLSTNTLRKTVLLHSTTTTIAIAAVLLLTILAIKYWSSLKVAFKRNNRSKQQPMKSTLPRSHSAPEITQDFDKVLASVGRQHVHN